MINYDFTYNTHYLYHQNQYIITDDVFFSKFYLKFRAVPQITMNHNMFPAWSDIRNDKPFRHTHCANEKRFSHIYYLLSQSIFFLTSSTHIIQYKHRPTWTGIPMVRSALFNRIIYTQAICAHLPPPTPYLRCGPSHFIRFESLRYSACGRKFKFIIHSSFDSVADLCGWFLDYRVHWSHYLYTGMHSDLQATHITNTLIYAPTAIGIIHLTI